MFDNACQPLFDLMEKASSEEKLNAAAATGVVSRKASPDGYRYEDRETGKPVDPDAYKVPYLEHVRAVRASRVKEFAAQRVTAPSPAPALPEPVGESTPEAELIASVDNDTVSPAAAATGEVGEARLEEEVQPVAPTTEADLGTGAADAIVEEESLKEGRLPDVVSLPTDVVVEAEAGSDEVPLEEADAAAISAQEDMVGAGSNGVEAEDDGACVVGEVDSPAVFPDAGPRAPATPATVAGEGGSPVAAATSVTTAETPIAVEQESVAAVWEKDAADGGTACAESETLIAVAPTALLVGGVEDGGEEEDASVEDAKVHAETWDNSSAVVDGDEVETPSLSSAAGDVCTPVAASASSEPVSTRPEEPDEDCDVHDAAIVSPVSHAEQETPHACGPDSSGEASSGRGGGMSSPHLSEVPSPVLVNDGGLVSPVTASPACAEPVQDEARGDNPVTFGDSSGRGDGSDWIGEGEAAAPGGSTPSPRRNGPSPRGSAAEHGASDEGSAAVAASFPRSTPPAAAAAAASPLVTDGGHGQQQEGPMSGRTPEPVERAQREFPSSARPTPPYLFSDAGSPAVSEIAASPAGDEQGAQEIAVLKERLWAAWDAAVLEYEKGVAVVRSKYKREASLTPAASAIPAQEESAVVSRSPGDAADPTPIARGVAETSRQEDGASASGPKAATTPAPFVASTEEEAVAEEPAVAAPTAADDMPTPDSPLLPLLQLRLKEEEGDLFEYSSSWRGSGAGGEESSQARGGNTRRRSLAKAFSSQKTRKGPKVQEAVVSAMAGKSQGAAEAAAAQETGEPETGGSGGSDGAAVLCRLCCRKACDTVFRPCEHSACGVCVEKIRRQAEQSGQALSCPWDRKVVDDICTL